eukprot:7022852-Pyramimonas_sp.AAC.1
MGISDEISLLGYRSGHGPGQGLSRGPVGGVRGEPLVAGVYQLVHMYSPWPELQLKWSMGPFGPNSHDGILLHKLAERRRSQNMFDRSALCW